MTTACLNAAAGPQHHGELGSQLGLWTVLPFLGTLAAIALLPLLHPHWWEKNRNKALVALLLAAPTVVHLALFQGEIGIHVLSETARDYVSFLTLLASLFVITGGIHIRGSLAGTPIVNTAIFAVGAALANVIGTTGASVLLIRPVLRANARRRRKAHVVVFFIFIVSNCGGLLTPLGDPPLFLGFLRGVPFEWTLGLWKEWLLVNGALLLVFNLWDQIVLNREEFLRRGSQLEEVQRHEPLRVEGGQGFLFLLCVMATICAAGRGLFHGGRPWPFGVQEGIVWLTTALAWIATPARHRRDNRFEFAPIVEVAVLFAAIFATMGPTLAILNAWGYGQREVLGQTFALESPSEFFWATGLLSSFLDNAPTYLTLSATAAGLHGIPADGRYLGVLLEEGPTAVQLISAISCGAVMMGANTYIGNGPNFMVKAIAEREGVDMPGFFGYLLYSGAVLLPLFAAVTWIFFR